MVSSGSLVMDNSSSLQLDASSELSITGCVNFSGVLRVDLAAVQDVNLQVLILSQCYSYNWLHSLLLITLRVKAKERKERNE